MSPRNGAEPGSDVHRRLAALEAEITRLRAALAAARLETRGAQAVTAIALDATREARTDAAAAATRHARSMAEGRADLADAAALNARLRDLNAALRASEERLDAVVESATDNAIIQMDFDGRITGWSPGAERVLGWSAAEAIGQDGAIIWTPEDCAAGLPQRERRLADTAGSAAGDRWHVKRDGTRFWGSGHLTPLRNGRPRGYLKVLRDRTAEWRAEEVLRENAARGAFLLALSDALRSAAGPQAAMAAAAGLFARRLGLALAQYLVIHPDGDGFDVVASCGDGRLPAALARSGRITDHGPGWGEQFRRGEAVFCDDHEARPAADAVASRAFGVRAGSAVPLLRDGRLVAIFTTAHPEPRRWTEAEKALQHEVAERTWAAVEQARAEAARREAEARFRAMADTAPVLIWESDETGVTFVNGHYLAFFGVAFDAVRGMGWTDFLHPDDAERYVAEYRDASSARRPCALEARFRRADGQYRWLRNTGGPVGEARFVGCSLDVTDLLDAQLALRASQARLAADLAAMEALQRISGELVGERDPASLYARIVEAAAALMRADAACMQALDTAAGRLKLVAWRGLDPAAAAHWDQVRADTGSVCGRALAGDARIVVPDLDATDRDAEDREAFRRSGILSFQSTPLRARSGRVVGMLSTHWRDRHTPCAAELRAFDVLARLAADLVERLQVDERLRESEGRFRDFAENSADVLWITDRAGKRLEYLSPAFERVFGEPRDRVMADLRRFHELVHPEDRAAVAGLLPRALAGEAVVAHYRVVRPCDGRITHLRDTGFPIRDASGGVARAAGIAQDVSDIARASAALAAEKERFRTLAEGIPQLVFRSGPAGDWSWASPQWTAFTGLSDAASRGRGWLEAVHPEDRDGALAAWERAGAAGVFEAEYHLRHAGEARWRWFQTRGLPVRGAGEEAAIEWLGASTDVDDQVRAREALARDAEELEARVSERTAELMAAEAALRQSQKMEAIGQLTGGIAHDFNNMLQGVVGGLDMARRRLEQGRGEDAARYMAAARDAAERAAGLTRRLLAFARRQRLEPKPVHADAQISGMADLVRRTVGPAIALELVLCDGSWPVLCDPGELESAILNLCINARDAMPEGGRLTIATEELRLPAADPRRADDPAPGDYVAVRVSDTGIGMSPEVLERVLEPFFTTKPQGEGTGLGLSQVYGFARQTGGVLRIASTPGRGTCVHILLPRAEQASVPVDMAAQAAPPGVDTVAGGTVLMVDDEIAVRAPAGERLRDLGYRVVEAPDGPSALRMLDEGLRPDLLVSDVGLPNGMDGRAVAEAARRRIPGLRVIFMTGYARVALPEDVPVITKPFDLQLLAARVRTALQG